MHRAISRQSLKASLRDMHLTRAAPHLEIIPLDGALYDLAEHNGAVPAAAGQLCAVGRPHETRQASALWPGRQAHGIRRRRHR